MRMRRIRVTATVLVAAGMLVGGSLPARAVHLFPLVPGDPLGDCSQALAAAPKPVAVAQVKTDGFFFLDGTSRSSATTVKRGEAVTWVWDVDHCHSVTVTKGPVTFSTRGTVGTQKELVRPSGTKNTFTYTFSTPGVYEYICVHHASVGMTGKVTVL